MGAYTGHTVINGELKYASVSAVKTFDPRTKGGCPRRWHSRYVGGMREPDSEYVIEAKEKGIELDKEIKNYLRTGEKNLSPLATKGMHILDVPGDGVTLDVAIHTVEYYRLDRFNQMFAYEPIEGQRMPNDVQVVVRSALTAAGVPFIGELDILNTRGRYRDDDGEYHDDPPGTVEVADLKRKSNIKDRDGNSTFLMPTDLVRDVQMAGYGEWVGRVMPHVSNVRLSHLYFPAKPASAIPTKVTRLHVIDDCHRTWEYVESVVRAMKDVAREPDIEKVPGNVASCDAYGGCPHREYCSAYKRNSLDTLYGKVAADFKGATEMGLLVQTQPQMMQQAQTAPASATTQQQLAQEEAAMRAQAAQQQAQMPQPLNTAQLAEVCTRLGSYGCGFPALGGNAGAAYAVLGGQNIAPGTVFPGIPAPPGARRSLHTVQLNEVAHIFMLESELAAERAAMTPPQVAQQVQTQMYQPPQQVAVQHRNAGDNTYQPVAMPANTPPVTQAIANVYNQTVAQQQQIAQGQVAQAMGQPVSFLPPGAPESIPALAAAQPKTDAPAAAEEPAKKKAGRPKKSQDAAPEGVAATSATPPPTVGAPAMSAPPVQASATPVGSVSHGAAQDSASAASSRTIILINCRVNGQASKSLSDYVDYVNGELARRYCVTADGKPGVQDVRCAPKDSILAFGGWKGAVREVVKSGAGLDAVEGLVLHLDTFMDELNEAVADALRVVADQRGWLYIRGIR